MSVSSPRYGGVPGQLGPDHHLHGTGTVEWGTTVCLDDSDLITTSMELVCSEGGCIMDGTEERLINIAYTENNNGAQDAVAGADGWTNILYHDGVQAVVNSRRPRLASQASRVVPAMGTARPKKAQNAYKTETEEKAQNAYKTRSAGPVRHVYLIYLWSLQKHESRVLTAVGPFGWRNRYGVAALLFQPFDNNAHNLTLKLDANGQ
eukprot:721780-Pyramimonas_sp.AAC.1